MLSDASKRFSFERDFCFSKKKNNVQREKSQKKTHPEKKKRTCKIKGGF